MIFWILQLFILVGNSLWNTKDDHYLFSCFLLTSLWPNIIFTNVEVKLFYVQRGIIIFVRDSQGTVRTQKDFLIIVHCNKICVCITLIIMIIHWRILMHLKACGILWSFNLFHSAQLEQQFVGIIWNIHCMHSRFSLQISNNSQRKMHNCKR